MTDPLEEKERQLELILALDEIRDTLDESHNPSAMFDSIAQFLQNTFAADACAIMLLTETSDDVEYISSIGVPSERAVSLCKLTMHLAEPGAVDTALWQHTLGVQIVLKDPYPLGSFFVARKEQAFTANDITLFRLAESQIDSAIIQARMLWKVEQRNRELEAIYQIDRLRDDARDEAELISGFTNIILERYTAELCMIILSHIDNEQQFIVRGVVDKAALPQTALEAIRELTEDIRIPQVIATPPDIRDFMLLAAPFIVSGERLGAVVIGRKHHFSVADHRLLFAITSQMDSAVVHSRLKQQLAVRNRELETVYNIDQIRDQEVEFERMLQRVLTELCRTISSELGYIMLYNADKEQPLELKAETREGMLTSPEYFEVISKFSREALDRSDAVVSNGMSGVIRSLISIPLILNEKIIGVFGAVNSGNPRGFSADDRRLLQAITSQVDTAIFERLERRRMRQLLSRSVDPKVLEALLQRADEGLLAGERVEISVIFADIRGSTEWAERTEPDVFVPILNTFLAEMTDVIFHHGGTLDKFVGDEVISLFGTPVHQADNAFRAASAALEMQAVHRKLQEQLKAEGKELPPLGIGISSGEVIAGEFGPPIRTDFTAIGRVMNLGARLCSAAGPSQIIISPTTYNMLDGQITVHTLEPITPKGIAKPVPIYELLSIKS